MTGVLPATMRSPMSRVGRFRPTESGEGLRMDGRVLTKERCICGGRFGRVIEDRRVEGWFDSELRCADCGRRPGRYFLRDRKSTRLNSSHSQISYAVFCLKK